MLSTQIGNQRCRSQLHASVKMTYTKKVTFESMKSKSTDKKVLSSNKLDPMMMVCKKDMMTGYPSSQKHANSSHFFLFAEIYKIS